MAVELVELLAKVGELTHCSQSWRRRWVGVQMLAEPVAEVSWWSAIAGSAELARRGAEAQYMLALYELALVKEVLGREFVPESDLVDQLAGLLFQLAGRLPHLFLEAVSAAVESALSFFQLRRA